MTDIKESQGLEVVAWQDAENPLYTTGEKRQMHGWATDGYPIVELVRLSDATAVIDQLREQLEWVKAINGAMDESNKRCLEDLSALRKQLDEANSAYARLADGVPAAMAKYHKCKKQLDEARELLVEPQRFPSSKWADKWQVQRDAWLEKTK